MSNRPVYYSPDEINFIFARLDPQDVERFYQSYQLWTLQQQIIGLQSQITTLQQQTAENNKRMQQSRPSAIALAALARLQSHDVTNIELLDHMLARGEDWLDRTMQHLTYCEQFDFIRNNYTEWCQHALDGAYDWIDSMQNSISLREEAHPAVTNTTRTNDSLDEVTEEILLQKLMSEEEAFMLETTLKRPAVLAQTKEQAQSDESTVSTQEEIILSEYSDIPDASHVPIVQSLEVTQTQQPPAPGETIRAGEAAASDPSLTTNEQATEVELIEPHPVPEETIPTGEAATSDPSLATNEQATEVEERIEHSPVPQESIPAGVDHAHELPHTPDTPEEQAALSKQVEVDTISAESDSPPFADDEDTLSSLEISPPTSNDTAPRTEESPLTEANSYWHQMASQASTEQNYYEPQRSTRPPKKRGFLRVLFAVFFGR